MVDAGGFGGMHGVVFLGVLIGLCLVEWFQVQSIFLRGRLALGT